MQKQEFEERIERTVTDEQYKVIEEVYMWHTSTTFSSCQTLQNRRKAFLMTSRQSLRTMQTLSWTLAP